MKGIAIFIPAYNEEKTIAAVVLLSKKFGNVYVIDDGSEDRTATIARLAGATVIRRGKNGGYGAALRSAFAAARKIDADAYVFLDGDLQHDPEEIPSVAAPVLSGKADACLGSRFLGKAVGAPFGRLGGVRLVNGLSSIRTGRQRLDFECGFRAYSKNAIRKIELAQDGYEAGSEAIALALDAGLSVVEVPVTVRYFDGGRNPLAHGVGLVSHILNAIARRKPLLFFAGSGFAMLIVSGFLGIFVVKTYYGTGMLATGSAFLTVFTGIAGLVLLSIGINIYTLGTLLDGKRNGGSG